MRLQRKSQISGGPKNSQRISAHSALFNQLLDKWKNKFMMRLATELFGGTGIGDRFGGAGAGESGSGDSSSGGSSSGAGGDGDRDSDGSRRDGTNSGQGLVEAVGKVKRNGRLPGFRQCCSPDRTKTRSIRMQLGRSNAMNAILQFISDQAMFAATCIGLILLVHCAKSARTVWSQQSAMA